MCSSAYCNKSNKELEIQTLVCYKVSFYLSNEASFEVVASAVAGKNLVVNQVFTNHHVGKPTICIGENKGADQLRGNREADQRLCFRYSDSTIPLLLKSEISSLLLFSVTVQVGLCRTCSETRLLVFPRDGSYVTEDSCLKRIGFEDKFSHDNRSVHKTRC